MAWSWKICRIAGIPIYIHWTFLILIGWLVVGHVSRGHDLETTIEGVGFVLAIFGCVVLHELGHALAARHYGVPTADITLLPIGGVARLQRIPEHPTQELVVALAGPAVNVLIVLLLLLIGVRPPVDATRAPNLLDSQFLQNLEVVNIFLVVFNLIPAFPMDGGRVLRALLAMRLEYVKATRIAASIGQFMAIVFGFIGLYGNPMLLLIALFVWIGAEAEATQVQERVVLGKVPVRAAMLTDFRTLAPTDTLGHAAELLLAGAQQDFPVLHDGNVSGVLTRSGLMSNLARLGTEARIGEAELQELGSVAVDAPLVPALSRLREAGAPCLQVFEGDRPVGLLTLENIGEYLMLRAALSGATPAPAQRA
jgi:Zn-dependent protease